MPDSTDRSSGRTKCQAGRPTGGEDYSPLPRGLVAVLVSRPATTNTSFCVPFAEAPYAAEYEPISEPAEFIADAQSARQARTAAPRLHPHRSVRPRSVGTNRVENRQRLTHEGCAGTPSADTRRAGRLRHQQQCSPVIKSSHRGLWIAPCRQFSRKTIVLILMDSSLWYLREEAIGDELHHHGCDHERRQRQEHGRKLPSRPLASPGSSLHYRRCRSPALDRAVSGA